MRTWTLPLGLVVVAALLAFSAACGGDDENGDTEGGETPVGVLTPRAGSPPATSPGARATPPATSEGGAATPGTPREGGGGTTVEISADNSESFSTDELRAPAGTVTVVFDNQDPGVIHNWALYPSSDELDEPIAATDLTTGPATTSVTFTVEPGEYYFRCDVHPQMEGTFIAE